MNLKKEIMKTYILFLFFAVLTLVGCSKNDDGPKLPPITQTGENTFGCYINGRLLVPRNGTGTFNAPDNGLRFIVGPGPDEFYYHEIKVQDFIGSKGGSMDIHIIDLYQNGAGNYEIQKSNCALDIDANNSINIRCRYYNGQSYDYYCSIEGTGSLNIMRFDLENRIVSGTFNFKARNENNSNDIIEITEGRFDIKWDELNSNPL